MDFQPIKPTLPAKTQKPLPQVSSGGAIPAVDEARKTASKPAPQKALDKALPFRPIARPPMAVLEILDDGADDGESIRVRSGSVTIGRTNGDIIISQDTQISGEHARIARRVVDGGYRWYLSDLGSTNGTFIRAAKAKLSEGKQIIIGSFRYRFRGAGANSSAALSQPESTRGWHTVAAKDIAALTASLVRLCPDGTEVSFPLTLDSMQLGQSQSDCQVLISDDPAVSSIHARLRRHESGYFLIEDQGSKNGTWIGVQEYAIDGSLQFQLGEQRFRFRVMS